MIKSHTEDLIILDDVDFKAFSSEINFSNDKHFLILLADERLGDFEKQPASYHVTDFFEETHTSVRLGFDGMDFRFNLFLKDKHLVQAIAKKITDLAKQPNKYLEIESAMKEDRFEELELSLA